VELDNDDYYMRAAKEAGERVAKLLKEEGAQARALFDRIAERYGLDTAKLLFERCIKSAKEPSIEEEQKQLVAKKAKEKAAQQVRAMTELPTADRIAAADRRQICIWWYRLPARKFTAAEQTIVDLLWRHYVEVGGYPEGFKPERLPPPKKRGSITHNSPNAKLPAQFDREFSELAAKLGRKPKQEEVAEAIISKHGTRYGEQVDNVIANWRYWRKKKI